MSCYQPPLSCVGLVILSMISYYKKVCSVIGLCRTGTSMCQICSPPTSQTGYLGSWGVTIYQAHNNYSYWVDAWTTFGVTTHGMEYLCKRLEFLFSSGNKRLQLSILQTITPQISVCNLLNLSGSDLQVNQKRRWTDWQTNGQMMLWND